MECFLNEKEIFLREAKTNMETRHELLFKFPDGFEHTR